MLKGYDFFGVWSLVVVYHRVEQEKTGVNSKHNAGESQDSHIRDLPVHIASPQKSQPSVHCDHQEGLLYVFCECNLMKMKSQRNVED